MRFTLILSVSAAGVQLVNAGSEEAESVLEKMESVARGLRDELEEAYAARCDAATLTECEHQNYNDCSSRFPQLQCGLKFDDDKSPPSECSCGILWDTTISTIAMANSLLGTNDIPNDDEVIETVCYSRLAEQFMVDSYHDEFWTERDIEPAALLFGSNDGVFRRFPAKHTEKCWSYDPRSRPWYTAASSPPKDVVLVMDLSQSMNDTNLQLAQETAITIINTLTESDRVVVVIFSSDASVLAVDDVLTGNNIFIEAKDEYRKDMLVAAIETLNTSNETSNLYNAFNLTFEILGNTVISGNSSTCNNAIVLLTDGYVDESQSEDETSKVISFVQEQIIGLADNFSKKSFFFAYSVGENTGTSLPKRIACGTGGIWKHLGEESGDLFSALSSYYKLFAVGLANSEQEDFVAWIEPFFWYHDSTWGTTVTVPVYYRNVTPHLFLGVAGVGIYMDSIERVLGSNATSWYQEWMTKSSIASCTAIDLTECQLDALRFLGGGENATCGQCNSTSSYPNFVPEQCPSNSTNTTGLWKNNDLEGKSYSERSCCDDEAVASESCPSVPTERNGSKGVHWDVLVLLSTCVAYALNL